MRAATSGPVYISSHFIKSSFLPCPSPTLFSNFATMEWLSWELRRWSPASPLHRSGYDLEKPLSPENPKRPFSLRTNSTGRKHRANLQCAALCGKWNCFCWTLLLFSCSLSLYLLYRSQKCQRASVRLCRFPQMQFLNRIQFCHWPNPEMNLSHLASLKTNPANGEGLLWIPHAEVAQWGIQASKLYIQQMRRTDHLSFSALLPLTLQESLQML